MRSGSRRAEAALHRADLARPIGVAGAAVTLVPGCGIRGSIVRRSFSGLLFLLLGCSDVAARVSVSLDARTQAVIVAVDRGRAEPELWAQSREDFSAKPLLLPLSESSTVVLLEYEETLALLALPSGLIPRGNCRPVPEPMLARQVRRAGLSASGRLVDLAPGVTLIRIACADCPGQQADERGRCCTEGARRTAEGRCLDRCADGAPVPSSGRCLPSGCAPGLVLDDRGRCIEVSDCPAGSIADDPSGTCHRPGSCRLVPGYHDDGSGRCAPLGTCAPGLSDRGGGQCFPPDRCAPGYHDGGDGRCLVAPHCSAGWRDGGAGSCVASSTCSPGFLEVFGLGCLAEERCPLGQHDGGAGRCVAEDTCESGFFLDAAGVCYRWRQLASMNVPRFAFAGGSRGGLDLIAVGGNNDDHMTLDSVELYDAAHDRWTFGPPLTEPVLKSTFLPWPGDRLLLVGGTNSPTWTSAPANLLVVEPDGRSAPFVSPPPEPRFFGAQAVVLPSGDLLIAEGARHDGSRERMATDTEIFEVAAERWIAFPGSPDTAAFPSFASLGGERFLFVFGALPSTPWHGATTNARVLDLSTRSWHSVAEPRPLRSAPLIALPQGELLTVAGNLGVTMDPAGGLILADTPTTATQIYSPTADRWRPGAPLLTRRWGFGLVQLCDGRTMVIGGDVGGPTATDLVEVFDPRSQRWSAAGRITPARFGAVAVRRSDCSVAVIGGTEHFEGYNDANRDRDTLPTGAHAEVSLYESPGLRARR